MKRSIITLISLNLATTLCIASPGDAAPAIKIVFADKYHLCLNDHGQVNFKFTYHYNANLDFEYYSKINDMQSEIQTILAPTPAEQGYANKYTYNYFAISSAGDCGKRDFNYTNPGNCYVQNIIPSNLQNKPVSYQITLTPEPTIDKPYGDKTYNLHCDIQHSS